MEPPCAVLKVGLGAGPDARCSPGLRPHSPPDGGTGAAAAAREPQYGSPKKMNVVPVTIGALAPTNDTLASLTWRDPARPDPCNAPSIMCQRPWMRPVPRLPPKVLSAVEL